VGPRTVLDAVGKRKIVPPTYFDLQKYIYIYIYVRTNDACKVGRNTCGKYMYSTGV
jgi:hypothetical protein